jgi:hypothetical protein
MFVEHLRMNPADRRWLLAVLDQPRDQTTLTAVEDVMHRFIDGGALDAVLQRMMHMATRAHHATVLETQPRLRQLTLDLIGLVLRPIQHLFATTERASLRDVHA